MSFQDAIKKSVLDGFAAGEMSTTQILVVLGITFLIGVYIFFIYRLVAKSAMYDRGFHVAMAIISVITAGIIVAMQSSIVISLGMVGALSIVRFRTAVKDTMDLLFLFWSIGEGIICGAGLYELAIIVALAVTAGIFLLEYMPGNKKPYLLIINCNSRIKESELTDAMKPFCSKMTVKSRNLKASGADYIYEVSTGMEEQLLNALAELEEVDNTSLLTHEGEVRF